MESVSSQRENFISLLEMWSSINSYTENIEGLSHMLTALKRAFQPLEGKIHQILLPPRQKIDSKGQMINIPVGDALLIKKHPEAPIQILLAGHMDTVYPISSSFQIPSRISPQILQGPGVADMKGGLLIILKALEILEKSSAAGKIGWEVLITPDEEVGSPSSTPLYRECAKKHQLGLIFEPSFPNGNLVSSRKGSANFTVIARGKAAHAGRDFALGRNAITALARFIMEAEALNEPEKGITINIGHIEGGGPVNIVPDLAICRINIRMMETVDLQTLKQKFDEIAKRCNCYEGISLMLHEQGSRSPKPFDKKTKELFESMKSRAQTLGIELDWQPSGGVCDGNILAEEGLPTIDTLGAIGGNLHTSDEYILVHSLVERTLLVSEFLINLCD